MPIEIKVSGETADEVKQLVADLADTVFGMSPADIPVTTEVSTVEESEPNPVAPPKAEAAEKVKTDKEKEPSISMEVVREKLADFTAQSKENQLKIKEALTSLGAEKLSDVDPSQYKDLLERAGVAS